MDDKEGRRPVTLLQAPPCHYVTGELKNNVLNPFRGKREIFGQTFIWTVSGKCL